MPLTVGSMFCGIGGIDLGLERAGMQTRWGIEIDEYAAEVFKKRFPDAWLWRDVRFFLGGKRWRRCRAAWNVDLIAAGFPCQDISTAGKGAGLAGERSGLFFEVMRVVRLLRPRFLLLENVPALTVRGLDRILGEVAALGYDAEWDCIPAAAVGAPHLRWRIFIVAHAQVISLGAGLRADKQGGERRRRFSDGCSTKDAPIANGDGCYQARSRLTETGSNGIERDNWWFTEPDVGRVADGIPSRVDRLRGLGNAVVPQVAEWIGRRIVEMEGTEA